MDFDFTQEQVMLRDVTREFLARESTPKIVREVMEDPLGYREPTWKQLADMGLLGLLIDPNLGGQGLGMIDLALVLEEMGRAAFPSPYFATSLLAATALAAGGNSSQMQAYLRGIASGQTKGTLAVLEDATTWQPSSVRLAAERRGGDYILQGTKRFVPFANVADLLLVVARTSAAAEDGTTLFAVDRTTPGVRQTPNVEIDHTSKTSTVELDEVRVTADAIVGEVDCGWDVMSAVLMRAAVGAAAEMLGAARRCMEMSVEYAKVRQQFGQPIGSFQAIKHACAEMLIEVENAHAATYYAAWALDAGAPDAVLAASSAKAYVGDGSRKVCGSSIQVHGGIGFTWDYDLHLYVKRAKHLEPLYGDADWHRERALQARLAPVQQQQPQLLPV
ncbi:MAG TPA: acyl-CoA dehydrogenase family protein [Chloroflexota bacterium]|jgi:alkylation response protein AidB-like acyl-CoA dehydrogenase|nr:acyl-CoA dehydrogenase family protein [Chloroflexota bacterium]